MLMHCRRAQRGGGWGSAPLSRRSSTPGHEQARELRLAPCTAERLSERWQPGPQGVRDRRGRRRTLLAALRRLRRPSTGATKISLNEPAGAGSSNSISFGFRSRRPTVLSSDLPRAMRRGDPASAARRRSASSPRSPERTQPGAFDQSTPFGARVEVSGQRRYLSTSVIDRDDPLGRRCPRAVAALRPMPPSSSARRYSPKTPSRLIARAQRRAIPLSQLKQRNRFAG